MTESTEGGREDNGRSSLDNSINTESLRIIIGEEEEEEARADNNN